VKRVVALLTLLVLACTPVQQTLAEGALYDPVPPAGAAFVRLYHSGARQLPVNVPGKSLQSVAAYRVTPYFVLKSGQHQLHFGELVVNLEVSEGVFYTLIHRGGEVIVLTDQVSDNPAKATIALYNVDVPGEISLRTEDRRIPVIMNIATRSNGYREINAVRVSLSVFTANDRRADLGEVVLQRGRGYSVFVVDSGESLATQFEESETNTRL
jgi:alginate O-acetyltransferase complex protein AlgF